MQVKKIENRAIEVLQHEYGISRGDVEGFVLTTRNVCICTAWFGYDSENKIAFMCHFDHPWTPNSVPDILRAIKDVTPEQHKFKSYLAGGKNWYYSIKTRANILSHDAAVLGLNIDVKWIPLPQEPFYQSYTIDSVDGAITHARFDSKRKLDGWRWFLGPMIKAKGSA